MAVLATLSCGAAPLWNWPKGSFPLNIQPDKSVSETTKTALKNAVMWWNTQLPDCTVLVYQSKVPGLVAIHVWDTLEGEPDKVGGTSYVDEKNINIRVTGDASFLDRIIRHELGHALGLPHSAEIPSIMFPIVLRNPYRLTDDEWEILHRMYCE